MAAILNQSQLFFSYNRDNAAIVNKIRDRIKGKYNVWIDKEGIAPGCEAWRRDVTKGLMESGVVICFITKGYCESKNCLDELEFSIQKKKKILCILLEDLNKYKDNIDVGHVQLCIFRRNLFYAYKENRTFEPPSFELLFKQLLDDICSLGGQLLVDTDVFTQAILNTYQNVSERYDVIERIGKGGFSEVFLVKEKSNNEKKAMKVITNVGSIRNLDSIDKMNREAEIHISLNHENIVQFYESFHAERQSFYCIVVEYCEGGSLASVLYSNALKRKQIEECTRNEWMFDLSSALNYLHAKGVIHRDIVAENMFFKKDIIKLADFGVARYNFMTAHSQTFTENVGTPITMSPEMLNKEPYGVETDVWSLGCVFFEIETLEGFYFGEREQILHQITKNEKLKKLGQAVAIHTLIIKMLNFDRKLRPSSRQLFSALGKHLNKLLVKAILVKDYTEAYRLIRKSADVNSPDLNGRTPLDAACEIGHKKIVELLINKGADVNALDVNGWTPLDAACEKGYKDIVELLLNKGAYINAPDLNGRTPLDAACEKRYKEIVELLLNKGADVNRRYGSTLLTEACEKGHKEILELLLNKSANVNAPDENGRTPLTKACEKGHIEIVVLLLNKGANVNAPDKKSLTPLTAACYCGHKEIVELLLNKGADFNSRYGSTPLTAACYCGHKEIVELLLNKGANVNIPSTYGKTPLTKACEKGHIEIVELLLHKNADVNSPDEDGRTPLSAAKELGHTIIEGLLVSKGAMAPSISERFKSNQKF